MAVDGAGNLYIAENFNSRIRKVDSSGTITTIAGFVDLGDGGPAVEAQLAFPQGVAADGAGNLYTGISISPPAIGQIDHNYSKLLASFIKGQEAGIRAALSQDDLRQARKLVNGGGHGLDRFTDAYHKREEVIAEDLELRKG